mgnify:CR=1 FL=1
MLNLIDWWTNIPFFKLLVAVAADSVSRGGVSRGVSSDDEKFQMASDKEIIKQLLLPGLDGYSGSEYHTLIYATMRVNGTLMITRAYPTFLTPTRNLT